MDPNRAKAHEKEPSIFHYTSKDAILYALGIGGRVNDDLHFLYENHDQFEVFPTFAVVPAFAASSIGDWPGIDFDLSKILHGEHYLELFEQLPPDGSELHSVTRVADVIDKGSGAVILIDGFDRPILHGLCSLGFAVRAILRSYGANTASNFMRLKVRFSAPVLPGHTLLTEMWKDGKRIHFQSKVKETGKVVLSNGYVDLKEIHDAKSSDAAGYRENVASKSEGSQDPAGSMKTRKTVGALTKRTSNSGLTMEEEMRSKL